MLNDIFSTVVEFFYYSIVFLLLYFPCIRQLKAIRRHNSRAYRRGILAINLLWLVMIVQTLSPILLLHLVEDIGVLLFVYRMESTFVAGSICGISALLFTKAIVSATHDDESK